MKFFFFPDTSDPVDTANVKNALEISTPYNFFIWAGTYHNISTILDDSFIGYYRGKENWAHECNRPLLCELEVGVVRTLDFAIWVRKRSPFFVFINDIISRIVEGGIFMHLKKIEFGKTKDRTEFYFHTSDDKYSVYSV